MEKELGAIRAVLEVDRGGSIDNETAGRSIAIMHYALVELQVALTIDPLKNDVDQKDLESTVSKVVPVTKGEC
jgi:hypothetical protein